MNHKNIVKYYGSFTKGHKLNIVLEYCSNGSLSKLIKKYNLNENIIRNYVSQILDGLEYLHAHNIIHRDIKCANILMGEGNVCKLTDFGEAKLIKNERNAHASIHGTANWMAPEIIESSIETRFSDIWSIGCTIIEMFQGEPPYSDKKDSLSIFNYIIKTKKPPKIPEEMSDLLKDFVQKCLFFEPSKRYNVYELKKHPFLQE